MKDLYADFFPQNSKGHTDKKRITDKRSVSYADLHGLPQAAYIYPYQLSRITVPYQEINHVIQI